MNAICKMTKEPTTWPCSAASCPLYGDCIVDWQKQNEKPMTNADRIRAMSDEELAVVIMCPYDMEHPLCIQSPKCVDCCLKWLQQPAEEVNNGKDG